VVTKNERKIQVLSLLASFNALTANDLAKLLDIKVNHARVLLRKYYKMGLLSRQITNEGYFIYWLSSKGEERLRWLEANIKYSAFSCSKAASLSSFL